MDELVEFLRARLEEDEAAAKACASAPWAIEIPPMIHVSVQARRDNKWKWGTLGYVATVERDEDRAHIARHDPARVLREVEAKRQILAAHALNGWVCSTCDNEEVDQDYPCLTLRLLALPYVDHPDYRAEWRP
ncbi:DUF6221 family protein [Streptomyces sp. NPDC004658]|uniref:DUF6221 family protein n=1 Tax=Streptomyces sp. NPDC004658 TaxID=3154672 RepID=UPI00339E12AE